MAKASRFRSNREISLTLKGRGRLCLGPNEEFPLSGLRVLVGRARHQADALSAGLRELGAKVLEVPFIEIRRPRSYKPLDAALKNLPKYHWLVLTSVNGVEAMWERLPKLGLTKKHLEQLHVAAIGPATKKAIEKKGVRVDVVPAEYIAESVVRILRVRVKGKRVLLVRAKVARDIIPRELRAAGAQVDVVEAYETIVPKSSRLRLRATLENPQLRPDFITFTSSSTVRNFMTLMGTDGRGRPRHPNPLNGVRLASIGPVTSSTLREFNLRVDVEASEYTIPGLIQAVVASVRSSRL